MKKSIYQLVNEKILDSLNQGIIPWQKPWIGTGNEPFNIVSGKGYSMLNSIMLQKGGAYATLKQWNSLGGKIRKGSKSCMICFWKMFRNSESDSETSEVTDRVIPMLRYYNVFHRECGKGDWIITGRIRVKRILTEEERQGILESIGYDEQAMFESYAKRFQKKRMKK